jgi:hypothetical protein
MIGAGVWAKSVGSGKHVGLDAEGFEKTLILIEKSPDRLFFFGTSAHLNT